jgi:Flp pilus assembly pilin Flp
MRLWFTTRKGRLFFDQSGQAMTEYILASLLVAIALGLAFLALKAALQDYYGLLTLIISLPIP